PSSSRPASRLRCSRRSPSTRAPSKPSSPPSPPPANSKAIGDAEGNRGRWLPIAFSGSRLPFRGGGGRYPARVSDPRRILVTGSTGLVGGRLLAALRDDGLAVGAVTRRPERARPREGVEAAGWDGVHPPPDELAKSRAILHLADEPHLGGPLGELAADERPRCLVRASAVGYYGDRGEEELDEDAPRGEGFLADVCIAWEKAAEPAEALGVRRVSLRIGVVLAREGGALALMARAFRLGLGGRIGRDRKSVV